MNKTPNSHRLHIGIFGRQNAGKSSLINAITSQDVAIVSNQKGTTTDPVFKPMEILPIGAAMLIDTPGIDDTTTLGKERVERTQNILRRTDFALLVVDAQEGLTSFEDELVAEFKSRGIDHIIAYNKCDIKKVEGQINVSAKIGEGIEELKEIIATTAKLDEELPLVADMLKPGDIAVLVVPIDSSAPKGRLILPQQQVLREIIDAKGIAIVVQPSELEKTLKMLTPKIVIADSQVFGVVAKIVPQYISLTSFSVLMARFKGVLKEAVKSAAVIDEIKTGDVILIAEGCTHRRQCDDIGTVKIPRWIEEKTGQKPVFEFSAGGTFPSDLSKYKLIIHCGACMLNTREMQYRKNEAIASNIPITNYGIAISHIHGILERISKPFKKLL